MWLRNWKSQGANRRLTYWPGIHQEVLLPVLFKSLFAQSCSRRGVLDLPHRPSQLYFYVTPSAYGTRQKRKSMQELGQHVGGRQTTARGGKGPDHSYNWSKLQSNANCQKRTVIFFSWEGWVSKSILSKWTECLFVFSHLCLNKYNQINYSMSS